MALCRLLLASLLSITAHLGLWGDTAKAFSAVIALVTALITSPLIAWVTRGRYYLARAPLQPAGSRCDQRATQGDAKHLRAGVQCW